MLRDSSLKGALVLCVVMAVALTASPTLAGDNLYELGNWPFGQSLAVEEDPVRDIAYVGSGGAVLVLDISDVSSPTLLSDSILSEGLVVDLAYDQSRQLLYVAAGNKGLEIWDVRDPTTPERLYAESITNYGSEFPAEDVVVDGKFAVVNNGALRVYDVTDPAHPQTHYDSPPSRAYTNDIYLDADGKVNAASDHGYDRYDILSSGYLQVDAGYDRPEGGGFNLVAASTNPSIAYLGAGDEIQIVDPSEPYFPLLSTIHTGQNLSDFDYQHGYLFFLKAFNRELYIWDVSVPTSPQGITVTSLPGGAQRLAVLGDHVYIADGYSGLVIVDISDVFAPEIVGRYETLGRNSSVALLGDYAYLAENDDGVMIIDIADPENPTLVNQYDTPGWAYGVFVDGGLLYIADREGGLRICSLTDPANPSLLGVGAMAGARVVTVDAGYAYVSDEVIDGTDSIRVFDVSDPTSPVEVGSRPMSDFVLALDTVGYYLYAACYDYGLRVLDVSAHGDPVEASFFALDKCSDVEIDGGYAYAIRSEWDGGLYILDISDPSYPTYVNNYHTPLGSSFYGLSVEGLYAYVTVPVSDYVYTLFLADPENVLEIDHYETPGSMPDLLARDGLVYVADGSAGLRVLENGLFYSPGADVMWEPQDSGVTAHLRAVHFADELHGCAVGNYGKVVTTDDGGETWTERSSGTGEDLFAVFFADALTGWVGGRNGVLLKTTDGGASWAPESSGVTTGQIRGIDFVSPEVGWAAGLDTYGGGGFVLSTTDGGDHWTPQSTPGAPYLESVDFVNELHGWAPGADGTVLRTSDGGASWDGATLPTTSDVNDVSFVNELTGWACTSGTSVYKTTDGGVSWAFQTNESEPYSSFQSISFVDSMTGWVVGGVGLGGHSYGTTDGGFSWKEIQGAHEYFLQSVCFVDEQHGWTCGFDGTILGSTPDYTGVVEGPDGAEGPEGEDGSQGADGPVGDAAALEAGLVLHAATPNPFNPQTVIAYELPVDAHVVLRVLDVSGRVVRTLVDEEQAAGTKSAVWDGRAVSGRSLPSRVYLIELRAGDEVRRGKAALLK